jgi:N-methylhydantoinase A
MGRYRFSFDIGGTFTDLVLYDETTGQVDVRKELTDPTAPAGPIIRGLQALLTARQATAAAVENVVCGATTLVTNLVIERKGASTALVTTSGFRDILEMRREGRYDLYDLTARYPEPLVPRSLRFEVHERVGADGGIVERLATAEVRRLARQLRRTGVRSVAVCLLHSYRNPTHEKTIETIFREAAPGLALSLSSDVCPEIREFERMSSTVLNAYVKPFVGGYFRSLETELRQLGISARIHIMQSNGGILDTQEAEHVPIRLLESGPAAGAIAAASVATPLGHPNVIAFDMGGTTAKTCLITGGAPSTTFEFDTARADRFRKGSGFPVRLPVVDLIEIGAGGGSIARVDTMGLLKVGPQSAGSHPGPACYGLGGVEPTVTDADLVLGYLDADSFLGGRMRLDRRAAERAIDSRVGQALGRGVTEAAAGIFRVVNENMANSAKIHIAEKGKDPRKFALFAFGGAGPVHAREIAGRLGIGTVIVPLSAGVFSAVGLLLAPLAIDLARTWFQPLEAIDWAAIAARYDTLQARAVEVLTAAGGSAADSSFHRSLDVRYVGQGHELNVPADRELGPDTSAVVRDRFYAAYTELFGRAVTDVPLEIISLRLTASCPLAPLDLRRATAPPAGSKAVERGRRTVFLPALNRFQEVPVLDHHHLPAGYTTLGPAVIEQRESTAILGPGDRLRVDELRNLVIDVAGDGPDGRHDA